jgi:hypothetical protein
MCGAELGCDVYEVMDRCWEVPGGFDKRCCCTAVHLTCCSLMSAGIMMV